MHTKQIESSRQAMTAHTPGPWTIRSAPDGVDTSGNYVQHYIEPRVCEIWRTTKEGEANARLIAAAPDLLAALQKLVAVDGRKRRDGLVDYAHKSPVYNDWEAARAAIQKATA